MKTALAQPPQENNALPLQPLPSQSVQHRASREHLKMRPKEILLVCLGSLVFLSVLMLSDWPMLYSYHQVKRGENLGVLTGPFTLRTNRLTGDTYIQARDGRWLWLLPDTGKEWKFVPSRDPITGKTVMVPAPPEWVKDAKP